MSSIGADPEAPTDTSEPETPSPFEDQTVRRAFVRKVFGIQILMLLFAFFVVCVFTFSDVVKKGLQGNTEVLISSTSIFIGVITILCIFLCYTRHHPWNLVGLVLVTLSFSFMLGTLASYFNTTAVIFGVADTILIFLAIIAFTAQSCVVYNMCFGLILTVALLLLMHGIMYGIFFTSNPLFITDVGIGGSGAFCISLIFTLNIQITTSWEKDRVRPDEYVTAALFLYLDIFLFYVRFRDLLCGVASHL